MENEEETHLEFKQPKSSMRIAAVLLLYCLSITPLCAQDGSYETSWNRVYRFELNDLSKSALSVVDSIYTRAKRENNFVQITRSVLYQSKFAMTLQPEAELYVIEKFRKEILESRPPLKNLLQSMLGTIYLDYWKRNRWRYYDRSRLASVEGDFRTWDETAMLNSIDAHFRSSLEEASITQAIDLKSIAELLAQSDTRIYRPTLYDLLAHRALEFYTSDNWELRKFYTIKLKDEQLFLPFGSAPIDTTVVNKPAIRIYQALYAFHLGKKDTAALVDLEINRLQWLVNEGSFQNPVALHRDALIQMKKDYHPHPASAWIDVELAKIYAQEAEEFISSQDAGQQFNYVTALHYCDSVLAEFPKTEAAKKCEELKQTIRLPVLDVVSERFVPVQLPSLLFVKYKNLNRIRCTVFPTPYSFAESFHRSPDSAKQAKIKRLQADTTWDVNLKTLNDYQFHSTEIAVPSLAAGHYLILVTIDGEPAYAYAFIQVTDITLIQSSFPGRVRYQAVNRNNGAPVARARVDIKSFRDVPRDSISSHQISDENGFVWISDKNYKYSTVDITVQKDRDEAVFKNYISYRSSSDEEDIEAKGFLFTDRSIYRPGQTLYFKGLVIKTKNGKSEVAANEYVEVTLDDSEANEIKRMRFKTNAFGSFSGEFTLPASGLTGMYDLSLDEDFEEDSELFYADFEQTAENISVEEYKRPGFEISFNPITGRSSLNDTIRVSGKASSFSGADLSGATVKYRITRETFYFYGKQKRRRYSNTDEVFVSGETRVNSKGEFFIHFYAATMDDVPREEKPIFYFDLTTDVTDITGETRTQSVRIESGYHFYNVTLNGPNKIERNTTGTFDIAVTNLNDHPAQTDGVVHVYKFSSPSRLYRNKPWEAPDLPNLTREQFASLFPHDVYADADIIPAKQLVMEIPFQKGQTSLPLKPDLKWQTGEYVMELIANDPSGLRVSDTYSFHVTEKDKLKEHKDLLWIETDKNSYAVDDRIKVSIGSPVPNITITVDIENDHKIINTYTQVLSGAAMELIIPANQLMTRGFKIHCRGVTYNSYVEATTNVIVIPKREQLTLETLTFRDKIRPGSEQTWSFRLRGTGARRVEAELLAGMYDASLDQFRNHYWSFDPFDNAKHYYSSFDSDAHQSFVVHNFNTVLQKRLYFNKERLYYEQLDWFGFSITRDHSVRVRYQERLYPVTPRTALPSKIRMTNTRNKKAGYIYGKIISHEGEVLAGVNVMVKGTVRGTHTDQGGNYAIEATAGETVVYSFVGRAPLEVLVTERNTIDVVMREEVITLSELVVTAGGLTVQRRELGNQATTTVATDIVNPMAGLSGKVPGLLVSQLSTGNNYKVVLRGQRSLLGNNQALLVLDGVIVPGGIIESLSAEDISSIDVLNGSAAAALYGSDGSNGALIINTFSGQKKIDAEMAKVKARKIFNETAFFLPHLATDPTGTVIFSFTTPESLTRWKLMLFAHTKSLAYVFKTLELQTQKEFMTTVHAPRFLRAGDEITLSAKINNLTASSRKGTAVLVLTDAVTGQPVDVDFDNQKRNVSFAINGRSASELVWHLKVPNHVQAVQYKVVARSGEFSDGEQNVLPVLSHQMLVTETLPLSIRGGQSKTFVLNKLRQTESKTRKHHRLLLEVCNNPTWYAVQALPYLMEFPYECAEQTFSRYYSNLLAMHIVASNPAIKKVFSKWSDAKSLTSALEKNPDLKSILLEETPWLRDMQDESDQKKRIAMLFDLKIMNDQLASSMVQLAAMQLNSGGFPWFRGGDEANRYITQHIVSGLGHLQALHVEDSVTSYNHVTEEALDYLDKQILEDHTNLLNTAKRIEANAKPKDTLRLTQEHWNKKNVQDIQIQYLYARSFFPGIKKSTKEEAAEIYFRKQAFTYWKDFSLYLRGMIALIAHRSGDQAIARVILQSLKENAIISDELGMYWKENAGGYYWYQSEIETQALLIEVFAELSPLISEADKLADIELLKTWLLKNKQVNRWKSTKATTEAIYALLLTGNNWIESNDQLQVSVGSETIVADSSSAGLGLWNATWTENSIKPALATVTVTKQSPGVAWGSLYWQYFEDLDKITPAETSLKLSKKVFQVSHTAEGDVLTEVNKTSAIERGTLLRVRIEIRTDREMEFIHMKDMRASGLEPVDVLSEYKWQNGAGYYQSTRDAATNFFFDTLKPGVYIFEYDLRAVISGSFSNGITTLQNMYAPEFSSHSEGTRISIK